MEAVVGYINALSPLVIIVGVPIAIAGLKSLFPKIPKVFLPVLAPFIGATGDFLIVLVSGYAPGGGMVSAALYGMVGTWLREFVDQSKKAVAP